MTSESADLKWDAPEDDGNSPVTGYIVEKKDASRRTWQDAGQTDELIFDVPKLTEGHDYLFHVAAENQYGVSDFVETTEPVTAKNSYSKIHWMMHIQ